MIRLVHPVAGVVAFCTILCFLTATLLAEVLGEAAAIAAAKRAILWGLLLLVPALVLAGASGWRLGGASPHPLIRAKRRRMPVIALNGCLVLVPCALFLDARAAAADFSSPFLAVQLVEILAGAVNLGLIALSIRDGLRLTRRFGARRAAPS